MAGSESTIGLGRLLEGKVAIITGAGRGIGEVTAQIFARAGARMTLAARTGPEVEKVAATIADMGGEALAIPTDISDPRSVDAMVKATLDRYGTVDILINNAAIPGKDAFVEDASLEQWEQAIKVDLFGTFNCCHAVVPEMKRKRSGRIIILSSTVIHDPIVRKTHYVAAKTATGRIFPHPGAGARAPQHHRQHGHTRRGGRTVAGQLHEAAGGRAGQDLTRSSGNNSRRQFRSSGSCSPRTSPTWNFS